MKPTISVIIPSYNHEKFVGDAIESVLNQTYEDFELIIIDDASPDNSIEVIKKYNDKRIRFIEFSKNQGAVYTLNYGISVAKGEFICILNSDDYWDQNKLEKQVTIFENNHDIDAVFSDAKFIDEQHNILDSTTYQWADVFNKHNRTQGEWLHYFFFHLNCLCHPSIMIRKEIYQTLGYYKPSLRQLPDFDMWVRLLKHTKIHVINEKLVNFRILNNDANTSADTFNNRVRNKNEIYLIMRDFFDDIKIETLIEGFSNELIYHNIQSKEELLCEIALLYFKNNSEISYIYKMIGIEKLYNLLNNPVTANILKEKYHFNFDDFFKLTGEFELIEANSQLTHVILNNTKEKLRSNRKIYNLAKKYFQKLKNVKK